MANVKTANVIMVDTSAQFDGKFKICSVKYIGNTSGSASIKADSTSGSVVWEESGTANVFNSECCMYLDGMYVTVANSAKVYIYLEA